VVRRAATTEGDSIVIRALTVDDHVPVVGERFMVCEADVVPKVPGERSVAIIKE